MKNKLIEQLEKLSGKKVILENRTNKSVVGIVCKPGYMLLGESTDADDRNGWLVFPGGGVDEGESIAAAVKREVREETGLFVEPTEGIITDKRKPGVYFIVCNYKNGEVQHNSEFKNMQWYDIKNLPLDKVYPQNREIISNLIN